MGKLWILSLPTVLREAGCKVIEFSGWQTRSRSSGGFEDIRGLVWHHTAGGTNEAGGENYSYLNSGDRPIGNMHLRRDGTFVVGAAGAANTQGKGGPVPTSKGTIPQDKGNMYMIAIEAHNNGIGEAWPKAQLDAYIKGSYAICKAYGLNPATDIFTHYGWCEPTCKGRKIDPAGPTSAYPSLGGTSGRNTWPQSEVRKLVAAYKPSGGGPDPKPPDPPPSTGKYTVKSGDSWWSISQKYGITVDALLKLNPPATSSTVIHPGQVLNVPGGSSGGGGGTYTVVSGDSWYGIASKLGCTPQELVAANPPKTMNTMLHPGDVLNVPGGAKPPAPTPPPSGKAPNGLTAQENVTAGGKATTPPGSPTLKKGVNHTNVPWLQQVLCSMPTLPADGGKPIYDPAKVGINPFDAATEAAVKYWQSKNGLTADGVYGPQTASKMLAIRKK